MIGFQTIALRLLVAILLGSLVGIERGRTERAAGFRTHALVCLGSSLFMIVSEFGFNDVRGIPQVVLDPSRIAAQVVSGIGFLGAGTIIFWREKVRGLTTAASIWATAAIGLAVGSGVYIGAVLATVGALVILSAFKPIEKKLSTKQQVLTLIVDKKVVLLNDLQLMLERNSIAVDSIRIRPGETAGQDLLELKLKRGSSKAAILPFLDKLRQLPGIYGITAVAKTVTWESESEQQQTDASDEALSQESNFTESEQ